LPDRAALHNIWISINWKKAEKAAGGCKPGSSRPPFVLRESARCAESYNKQGKENAWSRQKEKRQAPDLLGSINNLEVWKSPALERSQDLSGAKPALMGQGIAKRLAAPFQRAQCQWQKNVLLVWKCGYGNFPTISKAPDESFDFTMFKLLLNPHAEVVEIIEHSVLLST
jgi:hypothetical protein